MSATTILIAIALICFLLSAFGVGVPLNLQSVGLACLAGAMLVGAKLF